jgi:hypothetical protein
MKTYEVGFVYGDDLESNEDLGCMFSDLLDNNISFKVNAECQTHGSPILKFKTNKQEYARGFIIRHFGYNQNIHVNNKIVKLEDL